MLRARTTEAFSHGEIVTSIHELIACKSYNTQKAYNKTLDILAEYFDVKRDSYAFEKAVVELSVFDGTRFITWLRKRGTETTGQPISDNTLALRIDILRRIFRHLIDIGIRRGNPFAIVKDIVPMRQRVQVRPTKLIPFDAVPKIVGAPDGATKNGIRDKAILSLLFGGGLRRNEVLKLNMRDIETTPDGVPYLILRATKAGRNQQQSLPQWAWTALDAHLKQRDEDGAKLSEPMFCFYYNDGGARGRISDTTLKRLYKRYTAEAGIVGAAPHSARATAATALKVQGYEDREVASFLRHSTENMVRVYDKRARGPAKNPGRNLMYEDIANEDELPEDYGQTH